MDASSSTGNPYPDMDKPREQETLELLRAAFSRSAESLAEALSPQPTSRQLPIRLPAHAALLPRSPRQPRRSIA